LCIIISTTNPLNTLSWLLCILAFSLTSNLKFTVHLLTLYNSRHTSPTTREVVVAIAGMIFPAMPLLYWREGEGSRRQGSEGVRVRMKGRRKGRRRQDGASTTTPI
jgi:hypothetical protein